MMNQLKFSVTLYPALPWYWCFYRLKKAFDAIDHTLLLAKQHHGVRGVAQDWLSSYLENYGQPFSHLINIY